MTSRLVRAAVAVLPASDRPRYAREFAADLAALPSTIARLRFAASLVLHASALRHALLVANPQKENAVVKADRRRLLCRVGLHRFVEFSTDDGGRARHCARCGLDWSGGAPMGWTYDMGRRGRMGF